MRIFSSLQATSNKSAFQPISASAELPNRLIISITVMTVLPRNQKKDAVNDNAVIDYRNIQR